MDVERIEANQARAQKHIIQARMRSITVVVPKLSNVGGSTGNATTVVGNEQMLELFAGVVAVR